LPLFQGDRALSEFHWWQQALRVGQIQNDALPAFARRLRMSQILEPGIPLLEVLITNRQNKIADVVENPVRVLRVTAPNSRFDEAPACVQHIQQPLRNPRTLHRRGTDALAFFAVYASVDWNTQRTRSRWTQKINFLSQALQHADRGRRCMTDSSMNGRASVRRWMI
jgi:hypothetical protein